MNHRAGGRRIVPAVVLSLVLLRTSGATAANVILVPPAEPSAAMSEALVRIRGELVSEGFAVEVVDAPKDGVLQAYTHRLEAGGKTDALVAMVGDRVPDAVEIRVVDPLTGKPVVRRMSFQPASEVTAKTLAIHTLELIRATFLELDLVPAPRPPPPSQPRPQTIPTLEADARPPLVERVSIDVGATAIFELDEGRAGVPALLPLVRIGWAVRPRLLPHLAVAGLGTRRTVRTEGASAEVSQQFALVGASYCWRPGMRLRPFLSLAAGVLHTSAQGRAEPPDWSREAEQWSFLLEGGLGTWLSLGSRLHATFALQVQVAEPYPAVRFSGSLVKASTRPNLLLTATFGAWL